MDFVERTPIQNYFCGTGVFITGGSGFLGTALIEKLLRSCPDIKKIYLLMRSKKNKSSEERLEEIFSNHVFDKVKVQNSNYKSYISIINGELLEPDLGISKEDYAELRNQVDVIFHVAATVRFDEPIKRAAKINIQATKSILELAKKSAHIKAVVHVSTAFSQCILPTLEDKFYVPQRDPEEFLEFCDKYSEAELDDMTPSILGKYPNTYTFTKSLAENMVKKYENQLPLAICRPSVVNGCAEEPIPGWIKGQFGPVGIVLGVGMGLMRVLNCDLDVNFDLVPVDMCVNQMIAVAYETWKLEKNAKVYNYVNGTENPITWREYFHWTVHFGHAYTTVKSLWLYILIISSNKTISKIYEFFLHLIPAYIIDAGLKLTGKKPKMVLMYAKIHKMNTLLRPFLTTSWLFRSDNTKELYRKLDSRDQILFPFDISTINWDVTLFHFVRYARINILNEPLTTVMPAQKKMKKFKFIQYIAILLFLQLIYLLLCFIFKLFV